MLWVWAWVWLMVALVLTLFCVVFGRAVADKVGVQRDCVNCEYL